MRASLSRRGCGSAATASDLEVQRHRDHHAGLGGHLHDRDDGAEDEVGLVEEGEREDRLLRAGLGFGEEEAADDVGGEEEVDERVGPGHLFAAELEGQEQEEGGGDEGG